MRGCLDPFGLWRIMSKEENFLAESWTETFCIKSFFYVVPSAKVSINLDARLSAASAAAARDMILKDSNISKINSAYICCLVIYEQSCCVGTGEGHDENVNGGD